MRSFLSFMLSLQLLLSSVLPANAAVLPQNLFFTEAEPATEQDSAESGTGDALASSISAPCAVLMEASTGTVLFEKDSHASRHPASITKIMTLILIFEAIEQGRIHLTDTVTVSDHASAMGGSQVFLETGETQDVETMIKCISIASANDACVAMAEFLDGSEAAFVAAMNEKAKSLGMNDTTFVNCCGLDADGHMTSAHDVALMSRELTYHYPQIHNYCTVWMDTMTHVTAKGSKEFGLTNTNKLIRQYEYATGLKTGFTNLSKYCVSATAQKDDMELIAVIMGADTPDNRSADAKALLNYGFSRCRIYTDEHEEPLADVSVKKGVTDTLKLEFKHPFQYLSVSGEDFSAIEKEISLPEYVTAPIQKGDKIGEAVYRLDNRQVGSVDIIASDSIEKAGFSDYIKEIFRQYFS